MAQILRSMFNGKVSQILLIVWAVALVYFSLIPDPGAPELFGGVDKVEHLMAYAVLSFLLMRTGWKGMGLILSIGISFAFGTGLEILQYYHPPREASIGDVLSNGLGSAIGAYLGKRL
ncbi:MAG: VanZ family protein [Desulfatiglandales bacterium]